MKRLIYAVMLLLGLSIVGSCDKEGGSTGGSSWILGKWVVEKDWWEKFDAEKIYWYMEFSKDGFMMEYVLNSPSGEYAKFENGNLITPAGASWVLSERMFQYTLREDILHFVFYAGRYEKKDKDTFVLTADCDFDGTYHRIKSLK